MPLSEQKLDDVSTELVDLSYIVSGESKVLVEDLEEDLSVYKAHYAEIGQQDIYHRAWTGQIKQRMQVIVKSIQKEPTKGAKTHIMAISAAVQDAGASEEITDILFGQKRIGLAFAGANNGKNADVYGKHLLDYAKTVSPRDRPCAVFNHNGEWVTSNNRGFASLSLAGKQPNRIRPVPPTADETTRLGENIQGLNYTGAFGANHGVGETLPSRHVAVTIGDKEMHKNVIYVVKTATDPTYSGQNKPILLTSQSDYIKKIRDEGFDMRGYA